MNASPPPPVIEEQSAALAQEAFVPVRRSLFGHVVYCLTHYAAFSGRATRAEYWSFHLIYAGGIYPMAVLLEREETFAGSDGVLFAAPVLSVFFFLWLLAGLIPDLAATWRRLHDAGISGGFFFLSLIPGLGGLILFVMTLLDSNPGTNHFGPPTKYP